MDQMPEEWMDEQVKRSERAAELRAELLAKVDLPPITAIDVSNDMESAERVFRAVQAGEMTFEEAGPMFGSYVRMDGLLGLQEQGYATRDHLLNIWPEAWTGADPDDSSEALIAVWREAHERMMREDATPGTWAVISDDETPDAAAHQGAKAVFEPLVRVYRGQRKGDPLGCSWSLRRDVAEKFARGAWFRTAIDGEVIERTVPRERILAYLTGRGEDEVIIDPAGFRSMQGIVIDGQRRHDA